MNVNNCNCKCLKIDNKYIFDVICNESNKIYNPSTNYYNITCIQICLDILKTIDLSELIIVLLTTCNNSNIEKTKLYNINFKNALVVENLYLYDVLGKEEICVYPLNLASSEIIISKDYVHQYILSILDNYFYVNIITLNNELNYEIISECIIDLLAVGLDSLLEIILYRYISDLTKNTILYKDKDNTLTFIIDI